MHLNIEEVAPHDPNNPLLNNMTDKVELNNSNIHEPFQTIT